LAVRLITTGDVRRVDFGYFVRPSSETGTGAPRVEPVLGYLVRQDERWLLFDTGIGGGHDDLDAHYRPRRRALPAALGAVGVAVEDVGWVANCHLHFDHSGGNPDLSSRPIFVQENELSTARDRDDYTLPELVADGLAYETVDGEVELFPGVYLIPTPGHVPGHQSLVVRCSDGTVICAGQSHDSASLFTGDMLARHAHADGVHGPLPTYPAWIDTLARFDPSRVVFAHVLAVWEPAQPSVAPA
jgi:N-acyl homoserine lactone hydrolase